MKTDRIQDLRTLEDKIYEAVQQCIDDSGTNENVELFICPTDCDVLAVCRSDIEGETLFAYEKIYWQSLVVDDEPDVDAINEVASRYIFVR